MSLKLAYQQLFMQTVILPEELCMLLETYSVCLIHICTGLIIS